MSSQTLQVNSQPLHLNAQRNKLPAMASDVDISTFLAYDSTPTPPSEPEPEPEPEPVEAPKPQTVSERLLVVAALERCCKYTEAIVKSVDLVEFLKDEHEVVPTILSLWCDKLKNRTNNLTIRILRINKSQKQTYKRLVSLLNKVNNGLFLI